MGREYRVKAFKSGNSVAFRLPKTLGIGEGEEMTLVGHDDGTLSLWRTADSLAVLMGIAGAFSPGFMAQGRGDIEQAERDWSTPGHRDEAA